MLRPLSRLLAALLFVSVPLATALAYGQPGAAASASGLDLAAMDRSVDPCSDFYAFACGSWLTRNPIPPDRSRWSRFDELQDRNNDILRRVLDAAATGSDRSAQKIGDYYASCMDEASIERTGAAALRAWLDRVDALQNVSALPKLVADLHGINVNVFFSFGAEADFKDAKTYMATATQGGLGLPDRDYYFRDDARSKEIRSQYLEHVGRMLALAAAPVAGATSSSAASASTSAPAGAATQRLLADTVLRIETTIARGAYDAVARRDPVKNYHRTTPAELQAFTPTFDWPQYFRALEVPSIRAINVMEPDFFRNLNQVFTSTPLPEIQTYLRWQLLRSAAPLMSGPFVNENFDFYGKKLQGALELRPRWRRCVQFTDRDLGEALGQAFVKEAFGAGAKADTLKMVRAVETALEEDITHLEWMTGPTRREAVAKLHLISNKIGYPDRWRDYTPLRIVRGDALGNAQRAATFESRRDIAKIGRRVDKGEWLMTAPTVNAYYESSANNINFPAGILQPPFYGAKADAAVNYGGAGAVIGHELTHGFDDSGRQFDGNGNLNDWWTEADAKAFEQRASCLVDQYGGFTAVDDVKLNGKLTLGENTADNGGVRIALMAYLASQAGGDNKSIDGFTPEQRLFLGWGQIWCESRRPESARVVAQTDPHSPGKYRVNGVLSNMPEFQKAFSCKPDAPMVRPNACRVW
jgi:putative endopeptidase